MKRLLLKLSGEALGGPSGFGLSVDVLERVCADIAPLAATRTEIAIVVGGGNLFRGEHLAGAGMDRVVGDRMGMLATVMNALALGDFLTRAGVENQVYSSSEINGMVPVYNRDHALHDLSAGKVVLLSGGTGNPFFTTDTAACLRGIELGVDAVLKATNVDGVYDADPKTDPGATRFETISYDEVLNRQLGVMDLTAIVLCRDNQMPVVVFDVMEQGALASIVAGESLGTRVITEA